MSESIPPSSFDPSSSSYEDHMRELSNARARRRRARRMLVPEDAEGQAGLLASLARRAHPTFELFVFSVLAGAVLGLGYILDSQPILFLGVLLAPLLTPWVGLLLAIIAGSARFYFETVMALLVSAVLVFLTGLLAGFAARLFLPLTFDALHVNSRLWLPELLVLIVGAALLVASFVRSEARPFLPSLVVAYAFFLPVSAAGVGIGTGVDGIWPESALVFVTHVMLAGVIGLLTLLLLKLKPTASGLLLSGVSIIGSIALLVWLLWPGAAMALGMVPGTPTQVAVPIPTATPTPVFLIPTASATVTPTATLRPATSTPVIVTLPPSETPTITMTFEPTPILARIVAEQGGGAVLRESPAGQGITVLDNFTIVQVYPETADVSGWTWAHVLVDKDGDKREGWVLEILLDMSTPPPAFGPTSTPTAPPGT